MEYNLLGNTGIKVSKICFGGLTVGPLQKKMSFKEGGEVILEAFNNGINFIDTAELYKTYGHIKYALDNFKRENVVISTKSYAYDRAGAEKALMDALKELNTDYIDVFMMHEQESEHTIRGHYEALEYYMTMKEKGYIRSVGLSTHCVNGVLGAMKYPEIEVIHPIINKNGLGIQDGTLDEMISATKSFRKQGGGVFAMKPLGGGNLISSIDECFEFILNQDYIDSFAIGMQSVDEVQDNINRILGVKSPEDLKSRLINSNRVLNIDEWCIACGECVKHCSHGALKIKDDKLLVDRNKCVLCGYCSSYCKEFAIKII
ncbi:MAG: aldo/keto reductase [Firmicutes bacterium]|jgi:aryl-alcohol dehydrogenase-like predicted oxidoreductase/ferredoxin|nr:aldo/keto reductase [Bacillota bacterium]